jgi:hypothetical protein
MLLQHARRLSRPVDPLGIALQRFVIAPAFFSLSVRCLTTFDHEAYSSESVCGDQPNLSLTSRASSDFIFSSFTSRHFPYFRLPVISANYIAVGTHERSR